VPKIIVNNKEVEIEEVVVSALLAERVLVGCGEC